MISLVLSHAWWDSPQPSDSSGANLSLQCVMLGGVFAGSFALLMSYCRGKGKVFRSLFSEILGQVVTA